MYLCNGITTVRNAALLGLNTTEQHGSLFAFCDDSPSALAPIAYKRSHTVVEYVERYRDLPHLPYLATSGPLVRECVATLGSHSTRLHLDLLKSRRIPGLFLILSAQLTPRLLSELTARPQQTSALGQHADLTEG